MAQSLNVIIVEKTGVLKMLAIKEFKEEDLFKKCGFKKSEDFNKQTEWNVKCESKKYLISVYAKVDGRANSENKYDFPPPIDTKLFFGNCVILAKVKNDEGKQVYTNLSLELWEKIYEKLFGGFEDLASTAIEDENEIDELESIPKEKKTKQGYLKDGFVVDSDCDGDDDEDDDDETEEDNSDNTSDIDENDELEGENIEDIGSELSEDIYDYSSDEVKK
jgi:hypothetical protein